MRDLKDSLKNLWHSLKPLWILLIILGGLALFLFFLTITSEPEGETDLVVNELLNKIISQYDPKVQIELNPLRKEFMKRSNTEEECLVIVAVRDSILRSHAYKPMIKWLRRDSGGDGELFFSEQLINRQQTSAPMKMVYERIERMRGGIQ